MADNADSLAELLEQATFYGSGGLPQGQRPIDKTNAIFGTIDTAGQDYSKIAKATLARKQAELDLQKTQGEITAQKQAATPIAQAINAPDPNALLTLRNNAVARLSPENQAANQDLNAPEQEMLNQQATQRAAMLAPYGGEGAANLSLGQIKESAAAQEALGKAKWYTNKPETTTNELDRPAITRYNSDFIKKSLPGIKDEDIPNVSIGQVNQGIAGLSHEDIQSQRDFTQNQQKENEQNNLFDRGQKAVTAIRSDKSLMRVEEQRDAAATAYNRLTEIKNSGQQLNPVDYTDILGQIYKARTGTAPPEQVLQNIRQSTLAGKLGEAYTFVTGQQAPATTQSISDSLLNMAKSMGLQADKFHDGYMNTRGASVLPPKLSPESKAQLLSMHRGMSFAEATGLNQTGTALPQAPTQPTQDHNVALQWANANPNDPRAVAIKQKAQQALGQTQ